MREAKPVQCQGSCTENRRRLYGCPVTEGHPWGSSYGEGWRGKAAQPWVRSPGLPAGKLPSEATEMERTCPQYYAQSPFVVSVLDDLTCWEKGRLPIGNLPAPLVTYLRVAEVAMADWQSYYDAALMPDPSS